jgi:hypothetical protein
MGMNQERIEAIYDYLRGQLQESSTVRAALSLLAMAGGVAAKLPLDVTLAIGMIVSKVLAMALPDDLPALRWPSWLRWPRWLRWSRK